MRLIYLIPFLLLTNCYETSRNCKDFKTGKFYSEVVINDELFKSEFKRTKDLQVEVYNKKIDSSQLRWINDCEVIFKTINPKNMAEKKDIHLKILTTTDKKQKGIAYSVSSI